MARQVFTIEELFFGTNLALSFIAAPLKNLLIIYIRKNSLNLNFALFCLCSCLFILT